MRQPPPMHGMHNEELYSLDILLTCVSACSLHACSRKKPHMQGPVTVKRINAIPYCVPRIICIYYSAGAYKL